MYNHTNVIYTKEEPSTAKPLNDAYRKPRGTNKPFNPSPEQVLKIERAEKRARARLKGLLKTPSSWRVRPKTRDED